MSALHLLAENNFGDTRSGGLAGVAAAVEQARRECVAPKCVTLLVDAGDMFSGTPESDLTHGREAAQAFALLRYDAIAPGNREFDWGLDTLAAAVKEFESPSLPRVPNDLPAKPLATAAIDSVRGDSPATMPVVAACHWRSVSMRLSALVGAPVTNVASRVSPSRSGAGGWSRTSPTGSVS